MPVAGEPGSDHRNVYISVSVSGAEKLEGSLKWQIGHEVKVRRYNNPGPLARRVDVASEN